MLRIKQICRRPTEPRRRLIEELRQLYGGAMTLENIMEALGAKSPKTAKAWIVDSDLEAICVNNRKKWITSEVAKVIDDSKIKGSVLR